MVKKRSILTKICALLSVFTIGAATGCSVLEGIVGGVTGQSSSTSSGNSELSGSSENSDIGEEPEDPGKPEDSAPDEPNEPELPDIPNTPETPDEPETPDTPVTPDEPEIPDTPETPDTPVAPTNTLTITAPTGEVYPYIDDVKDYLMAGEGAIAKDYYKGQRSQYAPIEIKWTVTGKGVRKFLVEYATKADYSDAITEEVSASLRSIEVYNLYKGTTYYVRVTALGSNSAVLATEEGTFKTTDLGPRFMMVDDVCNMRDLGGYTTADGHTLVQGIAYRGGHLMPAGGYNNQISDAGIAYMSEVMGIKTEIDFRTSGEAGFEGGSYIPGATLTYITINGYNHTFDYDDEYYQFFSMLADEDNYPVYMHCTGGADRTGSAVFLLHTMLGVSDLECLQGYELTSYSIYGLRDTKVETVNNKANAYKTYWEDFMTKLDSYAGNTRQEKVETWMKTVVGITQAQIDSIKSIFYGETVIEGKTFTPDEDEMPLMPFAEQKSVEKQYSDLLSAWAVQKKEI